MVLDNVCVETGLRYHLWHENADEAAGSVADRLRMMEMQTGVLQGTFIWMTPDLRRGLEMATIIAKRVVSDTCNSCLIEPGWAESGGGRSVLSGR